MITKVQKWGNSQGLRLSKELLFGVKISVGDEVDVSANESSLVISPLRLVRGGCNLKELIGRIPADYEPEAVDWGPPVGHEVW